MNRQVGPIRLLFSSVHCILDPTSGAAKSIRTLLSNLAAEGVDCTAFTGPALDTQSELKLANLGAVRLPPNVAANLLHVPQDRFRHYISPIGQVADNGGDARGIRRQHLSEATEIAFTHETMTMMGIAQPRVLLVYGDGIHERALLRRCRAIGIKTIFYLTNPSYRDPDLFECVDAIITDSRATQSLYRKRFGLRLSVVGKFINAPEFPSDTAGDRILFVNPHPEKGVMLVLALIQDLKRRSMDAKFRIVESRARLAPALERFGVSLEELGNIEIVSERVSLEQDLRMARVLLLPSLWHESGSRVILEASSHGIPIVASDRGGTPELLRNSGVILDIDPTLDGTDWSVPSSGTVTKWADIIERLITDDEYYSLKRAAAYKRWRSYKIASSTKKTMQVIRDLVNVS